MHFFISYVYVYIYKFILTNGKIKDIILDINIHMKTYLCFVIISFISFFFRVYM